MKFLRYEMRFSTDETLELMNAFSGSTNGVLEALDNVESYEDLSNLGLVRAYHTERELRVRFGRVRNGRAARECFRRFLKHLPWASKNKIPRSAMNNVSVMEWDVAEAGNPWIFAEVLAEHFKKGKSIEDIIDTCTVFLPLEQRSKIDNKTPRLYVWVHAYMVTRASRDRILVDEVCHHYYKKSRLSDEVPWDIRAVAAFDPSLGRAVQHEFFDTERGLETISLTESFAELMNRVHAARVQASGARDAKPVRLSEAQSFRRLANHLLLTGVPCDPDPEGTAEDCLVLREPFGAETLIVTYLDSIKSRSLQRREHAEHQRLALEAAAAASSGRERRLERERVRKLADRAGGLSLESDSSSDDDAEVDESG